MQTVEGRELADALVVTEDRNRPFEVGRDMSQLHNVLKHSASLAGECGGSPVLITRRSAARPADASGGFDDA